MSSPWNRESGLLTCFTAGLLRLAFSNIRTQHSTSTPLPEPETHGFTSKMAVTRMSHWEVINLPLLPPEAGLNSNLDSYQSDERCAPPLAGSCASLGSVVHPRPSPQPTGKMNPPFGSSCPLALGGVSSQQSRGMHPRDKGGDNSPSLQSQI
jgi:hypothetical protein